jgi:hypothetical protein
MSFVNNTTLPASECIIFLVDGVRYCAPRDAAVSACRTLAACVDSCGDGEMPEICLSVEHHPAELRVTHEMVCELIGILCMPQLRRTENAPELKRHVHAIRTARGVPFMFAFFLLSDHLEYSILTKAIAVDIGNAAIRNQTQYQCIQSIGAETAGATITEAAVDEFMIIPENSWMSIGVADYIKDIFVHRDRSSSDESDVAEPAE